MASVGSILGGAFRLLTARPAAVAAWGGVYLAASLVLGFATTFALSGELALAPGSAALAGGLGGGHAALIVVVNLAMFGFIIMLMNAAFRALLRPEEQSFAYMRLGMDELRMFGLCVLVAIVFFIAMLIGQLLVMMLVAGAGLVAGTGAAGILGIVLFLGLLVGIVWAEVRLSLIFPMTLYRRRITVDEAWELTKGRFWTLFGSYLVIGLLLMIGGFLMIWMLAGDYIFAVFNAAGDAEATQRAAAEFARRQTEMPIGTRLAVTLASSAIGAVYLALGAGTLASAARELLAEKVAEAPGEAAVAPDAISDPDRRID